jgi:hypothetical protein
LHSLLSRRWWIASILGREGEMVSVQMLRDSDLFGELSDEKLEQLARLCREEVYPGRAAIL